MFRKYADLRSRDDCQAGRNFGLANWAQIVPFLVSYRDHRDALLEQSIVVELGTWTSLGRLLERFSDSQESLVQASVFWLVGTGRVVSDDLAAAPLSRSTRFRRR